VRPGGTLLAEFLAVVWQVESDGRLGLPIIEKAPQPRQLKSASIVFANWTVSHDRLRFRFTGDFRRRHLMGTLSGAPCGYGTQIARRFVIGKRSALLNSPFIGEQEIEMATFAGEVFWRGDDGSECRLRSTELGWEVELLDRGQATVQRERVRSALKARQLAKNRETNELPSANAVVAR
jgi:hypothetical protein